MSIQPVPPYQSFRVLDRPMHVAKTGVVTTVIMERRLKDAAGQEWRCFVAVVAVNGIAITETEPYGFVIHP